MGGLVYFDKLGRLLLNSLFQVKEGLYLCYIAFRNALFVHRTKNDLARLKCIFDVFVAQIYFSGVMAIPLIFLVAIIVGSISVLGISELSMLGNTDLIGKILVMVVLREVSPLFAALIIIARSGTAVATELGNMQVNKEIDSLRSMGIEPYSYIVFPRIAGGVISLVCLVFYFNVVALVGGYIVASFVKSIPLAMFLDSLLAHISAFDFSLIIIKNVLAGFIIFIICTFMGLSVRKSPHEVPQVTTKAVVYSISGVMLSNLLITLTYYFG